MYYFAYGSNLNTKAVAEWCRRHSLRAPDMKAAKPAVLENYRLCFPLYSEYWGGGTADVVYDPGKSVSGVLFSLTESDMEVLDKKVGRQLDANGKEIGVYKRIIVKASPQKKGESVEAVTYQGTNPDRYHIPPTQLYMDSVISAAYEYGLSLMWISYLQSFATQTGRSPRGQMG